MIFNGVADHLVSLYDTYFIKECLKDESFSRPTHRIPKHLNEAVAVNRHLLHLFEPSQTNSLSYTKVSQVPHLMTSLMSLLGTLYLLLLFFIRLKTRMPYSVVIIFFLNSIVMFLIFEIPLFPPP